MTFNQNKALIIPEIDELVVSEFENLYPTSEIPTDLADKDNYAMVKKGLAIGRKLKKTVEDWRKGEKKEALDYGRKVDAHAKTYSERILAIYLPMQSAKKTYDTAVEIAKREAAEAEENRVNAINERIAEIKALPLVHTGSSSDIIELAQIELNNIDMELFEEHQESALHAINDTQSALATLYDLRLTTEQHEAIEAENEAKRKEDEAKIAEENRIAAEKLAADRAEMEAEKAKIKAMKDKIEAEQKAIADQKEAERQEKIALAKQAKMALEEAERKAKEEEARIAAEKKAKKAEDARLKKLASQRKEREEKAVEAINSILMSSDMGYTLLAAIIAGEVEGVTFE